MGCFGLWLGLSLLGCQGRAQRDFAEAEQRTKASARAELARLERGVPKAQRVSLSWNEALELMKGRNAECLRASFQVIEARDRKKQMWRRFVPRLSATLSDSFVVEELGTAFSDPNVRLNLFLSLGNLFSLPKDHYEAEIEVISAELARQWTDRRQIVALYRLAARQRLLEETREDGVRRRHLLMALKPRTEVEHALAWRELEAHEKELWRQEKGWEKQVARFFHTSPGQVRLRSGTFPKLNYDVGDLDFRDDRRWGGLPLKIMALQALADDGRITSARLRYLPRLSLGVGAPPLYDSNAERGFSASDIRISPFLSWNYDSIGLIERQIERLERNRPLREWERTRQRGEEISRMLEGREALREIASERERLRLLERDYRGLIRDQLLSVRPEASLRKLATLQQQARALEAKRLDIVTSLWLVDEAWWARFEAMRQKASSSKRSPAHS